MFRSGENRRFVSITLGVVCLAAVAWLSAPSARAAVPGQRNASNSPYATQITELRAVRALLEQADHDYQGHRAAAVKQITKAIHALLPQHKASAAPSVGNLGRGTKLGSAKARAAAKTGGNEPQAVSDAQLKQALSALGTIQTQLAQGQGASVAAAVAAVQQAVQELQTALSIK